MCRHTTQHAARQGHSLILTLDAVVQLYVERELDRVMQEWSPKSACAIVVDPSNCDVLAMASRPAFDPNDPTDVPPAAWKNTAIASMYETRLDIQTLYRCLGFGEEGDDPR